MTFGRIPAEVTVFLDANSLVYHFTNDPRYGLSHLASNDADFDRVPWLTRYAPA